MKRANVNGQLAREVVEASMEEEDENSGGETMGTFRRASAEVMAGRKIIRAKRPGSSSTTVTDNAPVVARANVFGTQPSASILGQTTAPGHTTGGGSSEESEMLKKIRKLNESFLKWADKQIEAHPLSIWKDGVKDYIKHFHAIESKYSKESAQKTSTVSTAAPVIAAPSTGASASKTGGFTIGSTAAPAAVTASVKAAEPPAVTAPKTSGAPFSGFTFGAPSAAAAALAPTPAVPAATAPAPSAAAPFSGFSFGAKPAATAPVTAPAPSVTAAPAAPAPFAAFTFPAAPAAAAPAPKPAAPASAPFSTGFTFGAVAPNTSASVSGAGFGGFGAAPSFGGFGASSAATSGSFGGAAASAGAGGDEDGEGGDDEGEPILEPEKVLRNEADKDEILHEVPCKLFSFSAADKEWKDTGKGTFRITRDPATQKQRMLVRNQVGRINFNAGFYKAMKIERVQKRLKFAALVAVEETSLNSEGKAGVRTEMKNFMIQVKPEDLDATQKKMEAGVASCA